jgi:hypothetical protein
MEEVWRWNTHNKGETNAVSHAVRAIHFSLLDLQAPLLWESSLSVITPISI